MAREIDKNCVEGNCFAINDKSHGVGDNKLNIVYKANYTGQICTAKFRITSKDGNIVKEYMIAQAFGNGRKGEDAHDSPRRQARLL